MKWKGHRERFKHTFHEISSGHDLSTSPLSKKLNYVEIYGWTNSHKESKEEVILLLFPRLPKQLFVPSVLSQTPVKVTKSKNSIFAIEWINVSISCVLRFGTSWKHTSSMTSSSQSGIRPEIGWMSKAYQ